MAADIRIGPPLTPQQTSDNASVSPAFGESTSFSISSDESKWAARLVGAGSLLTLIFEIAYFLFDWRYLSVSRPSPLLLHLLNIALFFFAALMTLRVGPWMRQHWKTVAFTFSTILIASSAELTILTGERQPLFIALMLFLAGTGPFLSWGEQAQSLLTIVAIVAFAIATMQTPASSFDPYQWLGILIAAAIGLFSTALERRLRRARKRAEDEVERSRDLLAGEERIRVAGQLASGVAHDLNNTLNVIRLRLSAIMEDEAMLRKHQLRLRSIERAVEDAALTVARVRELGRNQGESRSESSQLTEVLDDAIGLVRTTIEGKSAMAGSPVRLESRVSKPLPRVVGHASELRQIFLNLFLNAYDAVSSEGGEIIIASAVRDDQVIITVSDNGPGIPAAQLERIFDPFFTTKGPHGTGLGLSIVKSTMEALGGRVTAGNGTAGGASFSLEFPVASPGLAHFREETSTPLPARCHFLVIDDDAENLDALRELLQRRGHQVETARSGREALEKIRSTGAFDLVLCDLAMPEMNGWEVARTALDTNPTLKFYIVSGWGEQLQSQMPPDLPIEGVLSKPIDVMELEQLAASIRQSNVPSECRNG
jgi:signal transduction histidine kinase/CheY-like chemotaxis protein